MNYEIIHFQNNQYSEYLSFIKKFEKKNYRTDDLIGNNWWAPENPLRGFKLFAYTRDEIASRCSISERHLKYADNIIDCFEIGGTCTLPQHRRQGLFTNLVRKAMELGFGAGPKLIYGTPNERSGPGYRKLQYSFVDNEDHRLVLKVNSANPLLRKLGLKKGPIANIKRHCSFSPLLRPIKFNEISAGQYIEATMDFERMNYADDEYLTRRLKVTQTNNRRFFYATGKAGEFYCATRNYHLGFLQLIMVSEYFLNGHVDNSAAKFHYLADITSESYRNTDGIYLKCHVDTSNTSIINFVKHRYLVHRKLPICYTFTELPQENVHQMMSDLVSVFQLTDCDIG